MSDRTLNCIVVDDDSLFLMKMESFVKAVPFLQLQDQFINPIEAGTEVLVQKPDLVFLDIEMPMMSGIELIQWIKPYLDAVEPRPQVVIVTGKKERIDTIKDSDVIGCIFKPELKMPLDLENYVKMFLEGR